MRLRDSWPAAAFCIALVLLSGIALLSTNSQWCGATERPPECIRNWLNAAGNLLAVLGAITAASFAFRQFKAANRQNEIAKIPIYQARIAGLDQLSAKAHEFEKSLERTTIAIGTLIRCADEMNFNGFLHASINAEACLRAVHGGISSANAIQSSYSHDNVVQGYVGVLKDYQYDVNLAFPEPAINLIVDCALKSPEIFNPAVVVGYIFELRKMESDFHAIISAAQKTLVQVHELREAIQQTNTRLRLNLEATLTSE